MLGGEGSFLLADEMFCEENLLISILFNIFYTISKLFS